MFHCAMKELMSQDDAVKVSPEMYKVSLENDSVRVPEVRIKQGAKVEMHSHPRGVAICLNDNDSSLPFQMVKARMPSLKVVRQYGSMGSHML
jgi:hypothetical protein